MSKYLKSLLLGLFILIGCEDEKAVLKVGAVPLSFTKKVLIEEFTGAWCGYCPYGAYLIESMMEENDNIIGVGAHSGDAMEITQTNFLASTYLNTGYPSGMVDRVPYNGSVPLNAGYWNYIADNRLLNIPKCGLAMKSSVSGTNATIEVHAGFNTELDGDYRVTVYLVENRVTGSGNGYDQSNFYNADPSSPFFELGQPIEGYEHNNTLRAVLSEPMGEVLDSSILIVGGEYVQTYTVDISAFNKNNLHAVAFIHYVGSSIVDHEILNVQKVEIEGFQDWD